MSDAKHETVDDIVAEMREIADNPECVAPTGLRHMADRLEAATKRESMMCHGFGNAATLREAMIEVLEYIETFHKYITPGKDKKLTALFAVADTIRDKALAALAKPPRNCDKYSHEEALRIWSAEPENPMNGCFDEWLYLPAAGQEGGAK